jgi:hypothetical protein
VPHATSLRVIGQSVEVARLPTFELETDGPDYILSGDGLTKMAEWILRHAVSPYDISEQSDPPSRINRSVRFTPADISRLDEQAQKQRKSNSPPDTAHRRLSQLLRTLGDHLDRTKVSTFHISWWSNSVVVKSESVDGQSDSRTFTADKLEQLGSHSRFRRSSGTRFDSNLPSSMKRPQLRK